MVGVAQSVFSTGDDGYPGRGVTGLSSGHIWSGPRASCGSAVADPVGILAVQGNFACHSARLDQLGQSSRLVRTAANLAGLSALILPGGESTVMLRFLQAEGLTAPLAALAQRGTPLLGTCAGLILMARAVRNPAQQSLCVLDVAVERNGYGRQIDSFIDSVEAPELADQPIEGVFIRAPVIREVGPAVRVLGTCNGRPVLVQQGNILASTFHPELSSDEVVHRYFLSLVQSTASATTVSAAR